ncbi:hypothetical protein ebA2856 [Aromatoleum aromaticum EbN1]|uniref:Uncharacterized protein n=1 Tax=Aromatoleum aromaticum (strain DSM 19018 / LMG 30748 / EbN1) TaxID=76114 RepID=Q5P4N1_AROAE|nr:hypothetical protein ebA2856 [Aromatoleum aromaticum EbN1]
MIADTTCLTTACSGPGGSYGLGGHLESTVERLLRTERNKSR